MLVAYNNNVALMTYTTIPYIYGFSNCMEHRGGVARALGFQPPLALMLIRFCIKWSESIVQGLKSVNSF